MLFGRMNVIPLMRTFGADYPVREWSDHFAFLKNQWQVPQARDGYTLQQDGAPPHYWTSVTKSLNRHFAGKLIGRGGSISRAPRSMNLSPLDTFLWGYVTDIVYHTTVNDLQDLRLKITNAVTSVTPEMSNAWRESEYRLTSAGRTEGTYRSLLMSQ
jgi:hypothetical protein